MKRLVYSVLAAIMVLFAAVQYNDPDGLYWAMIYSVPAMFAMVAAVRPGLLSGAGTVLLFAAVIAAVFGVVYYWPNEPDFWRQPVWWNSETAREGMGMMGALIVLLAVLFARFAPGKALR